MTISLGLSRPVSLGDNSSAEFFVLSKEVIKSLDISIVTILF